MKNWLTYLHKSQCPFFATNVSFNSYKPFETSSYNKYTMPMCVGKHICMRDEYCRPCQQYSLPAFLCSFFFFFKRFI